jgi:hypothetical protein
LDLAWAAVIGETGETGAAAGCGRATCFRGFGFGFSFGALTTTSEASPARPPALPRWALPTAPLRTGKICGEDAERRYS